MTFSGSKESVWAAVVTSAFPTGPRKNALELSESPFNDPLWLTHLFPPHPSPIPRTSCTERQVTRMRLDP